MGKNKTLPIRMRLPQPLDTACRLMVDGVQFRSLAHVITVLVDEALKARQEARDAAPGGIRRVGKA